MGKHILNLAFPENSVQGVLLIDDASIYDNLLPVSCNNLQITPPGFITPTLLEVTQGFRLTLNACGIGILSPSKCSEVCPNLPDGVYNIRYSVSPNDKVYCEYKLMRITAALNMYYQMLCRLNIPCCLPDQEVQQSVKQLDFIYNMLLCSKVNVEDQHQYMDGIKQYEYGLSLLYKLSYCKPFC